MKDPGVKLFIEKCIAKVSERLPAQELLMDPFLHPDEDESVSRSLKLRRHHSGNSDNSNAEGSHHQVDVETHKDSTEASIDFTVQGQRKDVNKIFLKLRIADSSGFFFFFSSVQLMYIYIGALVVKFSCGSRSFSKYSLPI